MARIHRTRRQRRGATAVEFAMTFPVLAILLLITIEYGWYFSQLSMVEAAAIDAARFGMNQPTFGLAETETERAAAILLEDLGFDCDALGCSIEASTTIAAGLPIIDLAVEVPYTQLTGILPSGALTLVIPVPNDLPSRVRVPIIGP